MLIPDKVTLTNNKQKNQFEWWIGDKLARVEYRAMEGGCIALTHTEVDPALEGKGVARLLVKAVLDQLVETKTSLRPYCSYVHDFLEKYPGYKSLVVSHP